MISTLRRRWWQTLLALAVLALLAFAGWPLNVPPPMPEALAALESDAAVSVQAEPWWVFRPAGSVPTVGLIFYPGGRVDPRSYAPAARAIAAEGYLVAIVPMPLNLAVLAPGRASAVIDAFPEVESWAVGGHSLGGAMAIQFTAKRLAQRSDTVTTQNSQAVQGLVLWAAFGTPSDDLSALDLHVLSIYATEDGLSTPADVLASRPQMPADAQFVAIQGGNHAQFGWYGPQARDNPATISRQAQQEQVIAATVGLLQALAQR